MYIYIYIYIYVYAHWHLITYIDGYLYNDGDTSIHGGDEITGNSRTVNHVTAPRDNNT